MIDQPSLTVKAYRPDGYEAGATSDYFHAIAGTGGRALPTYTVMGRFGNGQMKLHIAAF